MLASLQAIEELRLCHTDILGLSVQFWASKCPGRKAGSRFKTGWKLEKTGCAGQEPYNCPGRVDEARHIENCERQGHRPNQSVDDKLLNQVLAGL